MPTPSLLIVPARFKTGKLYSQIPTSGAGDFTVTRNTAARRFDSAGLVASVASGIPRLDYYTSGGVTGCPALLVEPAATNLALQSAGFQVSGTWAPDNATITTGTTSAFTAPDGSTDADLLTDDATLGRHRVSQGSLPFTSGTTYAFSIFVKKNSSSRFLLINANTAIGARAALNLDTLAITNIDGSGASVENYGNGWYRFSIRGTAPATTAAGTIFVQMQDAATDTTYIGNGSSFYLWGAQLETGSVATSYIPTTAGTGSRSADVISVSGAVSGSIGQTEGTIYFEYYHNTASNAGIRNAFNLEGNVGSQFNGINFATSNNGNDLQVAVQVSSSSVVSGGVFSTSVSEGWHKVAFGYNTAATGTVFYFDGNLIATRTLTSIPAMSRIALMARANPFSGFGLDRQFNNRIRAAALYTTRLTNAELATLTTP